MITVPLFALLIVAAGLITLAAAQWQTGRRLRQIERKLDSMAARLDPLDWAVPPPPLPGPREDLPVMDDQNPRLDALTTGEVIGALRQGKKILAIKAYRRATGAGLQQAKSAVDELEHRLLR